MCFESSLSCYTARKVGRFLKLDFCLVVIIRSFFRNWGMAEKPRSPKSKTVWCKVYNRAGWHKIEWRPKVLGHGQCTKDFSILALNEL